MRFGRTWQEQQEGWLVFLLLPTRLHDGTWAWLEKVWVRRPEHRHRRFEYYSTDDTGRPK